MHVMQYEIEIPASYDIRNRVQTRGAATDDFAGLGLKAYCITPAKRPTRPARSTRCCTYRSPSWPNCDRVLDP